MFLSNRNFKHAKRSSKEYKKRSSKHGKSLFRFTPEQIRDINANGGNPDDFSMIADPLLNTQYQQIFKDEYGNYTDNSKLLMNGNLRVFDGGVNGILFEILFKNEENQRKTCLLKCASTRLVDNLLYEFIAGYWGINNLIITDNLSFFTRTYNLFEFKSTHKHDVIVQPSITNTNDKFPRTVIELFSRLNVVNVPTIEKTPPEELTQFLQNKICNNNALYATMIEYVPRAITLESFMVDMVNLSDASAGTNVINLIGILAQLQIQLAMINGRFTHQDLHLENIILYTAPKNSCFQFNFRRYNCTVKCQYLVKIIDYGRCTFNVKTQAGLAVRSKDIFEIIFNGRTTINPPMPDGLQVHEKVKYCGIFPIYRINTETGITRVHHFKGPNDTTDSFSYIQICDKMSKYKMSEFSKSIISIGKSHAQFIPNDKQITSFSKMCEIVFVKKQFIIPPRSGKENIASLASTGRYQKKDVNNPRKLEETFLALAYNTPEVNRIRNTFSHQRTARRIQKILIDPEYIEFFDHVFRDLTTVSEINVGK